MKPRETPKTSHHICKGLKRGKRQRINTHNLKPLSKSHWTRNNNQILMLTSLPNSLYHFHKIIRLLFWKILPQSKSYMNYDRGQTRLIKFALFFRGSLFWVIWILIMFNTTIELVGGPRNKLVKELKVDWALFTDAWCYMSLVKN